MTNDDRELLERAAKAVGYSFWQSKHGYVNLNLPNGDRFSVMHNWEPFDSQTGEASAPPTLYDALMAWGEWNPLTNNADAFALMVRMGFSVERMNGCVEIYGEDHTHDYQMLAYEDYVAMPGNHEIAEAATRRAITRAAGATAPSSD